MGKRIDENKVAKEIFEIAIAPYKDLKNPVQSVVSSYAGNPEHPTGMILCGSYQDNLTEMFYLNMSGAVRKRVVAAYNKNHAKEAEKILKKFHAHPKVKKALKADDRKWFMMRGA